MRERNLPVAERGRRVLVITESHNLRHLLLQFSPVERELCLRIRYESALCVVNGIAAENEKLLDSPILYVGRQL